MMSLGRGLGITHRHDDDDDDDDGIGRAARYHRVPPNVGSGLLTESGIRQHHIAHDISINVGSGARRPPDLGWGEPERDDGKAAAEEKREGAARGEGHVEGDGCSLHTAFVIG